MNSDWTSRFVSSLLLKSPLKIPVVQGELSLLDEGEHHLDIMLAVFQKGKVRVG